MEREIKTKISGYDYSFDVYDTDSTPLLELLNKDIAWAILWEDNYVFKLKSNDIYDAQVYIVNKDTRNVEWGYMTSLGCVANENGTEISPEELRRALS